ncbi:MAG: 4'-phosphopantetheinyl transferase superfamily protein [Ginsengibacter sp.]
MPLFYQHNINDSTKLAVWHITENEDFFAKKVTIQREVTHPHKRLQHLAGRYLLQILYPDFPFNLIEIAASKKPVLSNNKFHFSISHCADYAAVIISENELVGIDVELITPKIELVRNKFLREDEINLLSDVNYLSSQDSYQDVSHQLLTLFWSTKECIFKWYGRGKLSFKNNMSIEKLFFENKQGFIDARFMKEETVNLKIEFRFFGKLCLAWVVE